MEHEYEEIQNMMYKLTHLGVNFMSKSNSIIRLFKNKHSLIWFLFLGYPGEK